METVLLVITGTMGSGKTTVLAEASDLLHIRKIPHAQIDLDTLGGAYIPERAHDSAMYENLASVSENYRQLGLRRFLIARALESHAELARCCAAVGASETRVCRLVASEETMRRRIVQREQGMLQKEFVERVTTLTEILDAADLEDLTVSTEGRSVTDIAREVLLRAGWISE